jgi:predicted tellurium resistance membrane protein TerC
MGVLLKHTAEVTNFYQIGHLDRYFAIQNILTAIALVAIIFGGISGVRHLRLPLRFITKLKFATVTLSLLFAFWFFLHFNFLGSISRY